MELRDDKEIHTVVEFSKTTSEGNPNEISNNGGHEVPTLQLLPLNEAHSRGTGLYSIELLAKEVP